MLVGEKPRRAGFARIGLAVACALAAMMLLGADSSAASASSGKFIGAISGAILISTVGYAFALAIRPVFSDRESGFDGAMLALGVLFLVKIALVPMFPGFGPDVGSYQAWALQIANLGPSHTYQTGYFLDYPPGYLYALWLAGLLCNAMHAAGDTMRTIVEGPALVADFFLAALTFAFVRNRVRYTLALAAMLMVALNPAFLYDSVVWGQSDAVLAFTMLLSVVAILESQYELGWALAAISVLVKPQGLMLVPVLGVWTMFETPVRRWFILGAIGLATFILGIIPFQIGHPWNWILQLYTSTAAYYHETSVNAFNLMALIGGLRNNDGGTLVGISYFTIGMTLLLPLYAFVAWILSRKRSPETLLYASFLSIFGFFMVAPRMHERYVYPAIAFAVPLAIESPMMLAAFVAVSLTGLFNIAYVLHTLQTVVFLNGRDGLAMAASAVNFVILIGAVFYGLTTLEGASAQPQPQWLVTLLRVIAPGLLSAESVATASVDPPQLPTASNDEAERTAPPLTWLSRDWMILAGLLIVGAGTRLWRLWQPPEIVFDEVHFVGQARHYLHGETFRDPHPPLAKLVIAVGILLFGDHPWSWRLGNAILGTLLLAITYLLGRRMFHSRLAAALAAGAVLFDGIYLVDSRYACIDIVYITMAALSYLLLFRFIEQTGLFARRWTLAWIGLTVGLCVAAKLYIPAVTLLLVMGFLIFVLVREDQREQADFDSDLYVRRQLLVYSLAWAAFAVTALVNYEAGIGDSLFTLLGYSIPALTLILPVGFLACVLLNEVVYDRARVRLVLHVASLTGGLAAIAYVMLFLLVLLPRYYVLRLFDLWGSREVFFDQSKMRKILSAIGLTGGIAVMTYILVFLPHFLWGWWGGMDDLLYWFFKDVPDYERSVASATHPYSSPWWSWPLMLRPLAYWQNFPPGTGGYVATVWGASSPLLCWGAFTAITITAVKTIERPTLSRVFLVLGYLGYLVIWVPIG
ncbi:MAG TPA: phospholipid carrier-dependent glycosyltransferase, partial [Candidatus Binataceae bacterium]|nr:phospholipid carrier-dependent glycosyltransferase [Candidatus Binataceae bacterium]